jgi:hypothetical protein
MSRLLMIRKASAQSVKNMARLLRFVIDERSEIATVLCTGMIERVRKRRV